MKRLGAMILEEPYRLFFPVGMLAGVWGVLMWPLFYGGHLLFYPGEAHARIMVGGFMGAFVAGFLGTAFPRLVGARKWRAAEFGAILVAWLLMVFFWSRGMVPAGDKSFTGMIALLFGGMLVRVMRGRMDTPPPGFVLVFAGLAGAAISAWYLSRGRFDSVESWRFARLFFHQGFLLLPAMGIGPYLLPRFFGKPSTHAFETSVRIPAGWWKRFGLSLVAGALVVVSFFIEARDAAMPGQILRAVAMTAWFAWETPVLRRAVAGTTPGTAVRWALGSMSMGLVCAALWPHARVGSLHLFFVSGLGLLTMTVGTRVILGHAGRHDLLGGKIIWLRWAIGLVLLAAVTRMTSDFIPAVRVSHHIYAAWTWIAACAVWLIALFPYFLRNEEKPARIRQCSRWFAGKRRPEPVNPLS